MAEGRKHRRLIRRSDKTEKRFSNSVIFLAFFFTAIIGYVGGTYSTQIMGFIGPVFGINSYGGSLDVSSLQETYRTLKANYDGTLTDQDLVDGANKGMVAAAGDIYTVYLNKKDASDFEDDLSGNIGAGIGAEIGLRNDVPTILRVLDDNAAKKAGVLAGDIIASINDESAAGWTVDQAVSKIRGEEGTTVKLSVIRGQETKDFTITRATINNPSVSTEIIGTLGIMTVSRFDEQTADLSKIAAQKFKQEGVKSVILDLRSNGGGYLTAAQSLAGLWLDNKVVVSERTNGKVTSELRSGSNALLAGLPTVVLVNGTSASASEIVAGALQDHGAAKLVGEKTYGKGSVQKLVELSGGAELKVTIAKWYTPNGKNINKEGIPVDIQAARTAEDNNAGRDPQLDAAKKQLGF